MEVGTTQRCKFEIVKSTCLSGTLPEPQPVEKVVRIQDSDFIPQAQTTSYGHDLRSNSFRQIYCVVVE